MGFQIAIDGPAASGKSTIAKLIAKDLHFLYIDTGAMYRGVTYLALENGVDLESEESLVELINKHVFSFADNNNLMIDGVDVDSLIRTNIVSNNVSIVAAMQSVRESLVLQQRELACSKDVIMDGRDIGTHVLIDADLKVFMFADAMERAKRRLKDNEQRGIESDIETLFEEIKRRDEIDSTREYSPLKQAEDAIGLDTTHMTIDEVVNFVKNKALELKK
jgi:cytidylate kinase